MCNFVNTKQKLIVWCLGDTKRSTKKSSTTNKQKYRLMPRKRGIVCTVHTAIGSKESAYETTINKRRGISKKMKCMKWKYIFWFHIAVRDRFINSVWARVRKLRDNFSIGNWERQAHRRLLCLSILSYVHNHYYDMAKHILHNSKNNNDDNDDKKVIIMKRHSVFKYCKWAREGGRQGKTCVFI